MVPPSPSKVHTLRWPTEPCMSPTLWYWAPVRAEGPGRGSAPRSLRLSVVKDMARASNGQPVLGDVGTETGPCWGGQVEPGWVDGHTGIRGDPHQARLVRSPPEYLQNFTLSPHPSPHPQVLPVTSLLDSGSCPRSLLQLCPQQPERPCQTLSALPPLLC